MRKKRYWVMLILCITTFVAAAASYYFKNILGKPETSDVVQAMQSENQKSVDTTKPESQQGAGTGQTDGVSKVQKETGTAKVPSGDAAHNTGTDSTADMSSEERKDGVDSTGQDDGEKYNGETFKDNGQPYMIKVNRKMNVVTIYMPDEDGYYTVPYKAMVCSVGLNNKTPTGTFKMQKDRYEWRELVGQVYGQYAVRIRRSIMFHSVPYYRPAKDQLESEEFNKLGEPASKGCVRLSVEDAKWIYDNCQKGTIVQIFDSDYVGPLGKPEPIHMDLSDERCCYDPTDDFEENPWLKDDSQNAKDAQAAADAVKGVRAAGDRVDDSQEEEKITDYDAPIITLVKNAPEKITQVQAQDEEYLKSLVKVTDESDIEEFNVSLPLWVSTKTTYRVVYTAKDVHGNVGTAYYSFKVTD